MTVQQPPQQEAHSLGWWVMAIVPGLMFVPLGVLCAAVAAWQSPRFRKVFIGIAVAWAIIAVFFYPWGTSGFGTSGRS